MTLLAVKPELPKPDIGSLLDALAHHRPVEIDCSGSSNGHGTVEVRTRQDLQDRLAERFPFRTHMTPVDDCKRVAVGIALVDGPPISGDGDSLAAAIQDFLHNTLDYLEKWERELRYDSVHQRYWGWVYRLLLAGDDDHILATLLDQPK
jgi:hypothetical protein